MDLSYNPRPVALLVESDRDLRSLAVALVEETELQVVDANSAEAALAYLKQHAALVSFLMTNIRLPSMDGVQLAQIVNQKWPWISVVVTSGHPGTRLHDLPASSVYMPKPWHALDVLIEVERAVHRTRPV
jgi:DNA-binding NtrC family response regulator